MNDTYGHQVGDEVLVYVAEILQTQARATDIVARYGGEEFVVLLPHTNMKESKRIAEQLRRNVAQSKWQIESVTVSIGIATITEQD